MFGRGMPSTSGDSRGGGVASTSSDSAKPLIKHVPLRRGVPFTPDRPPATPPTPIPGSGPRSGRRRTLPSPAVDVGPRRPGHVRKRSASSGVPPSDSGDNTDGSVHIVVASGAGTAAAASGVDALRRRPLDAPTPPTPLNGAATSRVLPGGVSSLRLPTPKSGAGAGTRGSPAPRSPRVPAVVALSKSDSPDSRERRNSMSASVKPVWELQKAHTSGSLEPESAMRQLSRSVTSAEEVDELLLLGVRMLELGDASDSDSGGDGRAVVLSESSPSGESSADASDDGAAPADADAAESSVVRGSVSPPPSHAVTSAASPASDTGAVALRSPARGDGSDEAASDFGSPNSHGRGFGRAFAATRPSASPRVRLRGSQAEALTAMHRLLLARHASLLHAFLQGIPQRAKVCATQGRAVRCAFGVTMCA